MEKKNYCYNGEVDYWLNLPELLWCGNTRTAFVIYTKVLWMWLKFKPITKYTDMKYLYTKPLHCANLC